MSWEDDTGTPIASLEELSALSIGSVILSNHGRVWQCKVSGWDSASGDFGNTPDMVWNTEKGIRKDNRFRVLYRKPGKSWAEQVAFLNSALEAWENRER